MQLPEVVTAEEMLSVTGKTKPVIPLYTHHHMWGAGEDGVFLEEEEEEEERTAEEDGDGSTSEVAFLASWAAAYPKSDIPHSHRGFNRLHHFCTASRDVELPESLRGVASLHHTPSRGVPRKTHRSDAATEAMQIPRDQLQQKHQQRPNTRVVRSAGASALARRQSWAARRILKEVDDELEETREDDEDDAVSVGMASSRASSRASTSGSSQNLTLDGMLKTWQFRSV